MVTLTFASPDGVSHALASRLFGRFVRQLRDVAVRKGSRNKIPLAPVIEDSKEQLRSQGKALGDREGTHIHVLMKLRTRDPYAYKNKVLKAWKNTNRLCGDPLVSCPNSDEWFVPITDTEMLARCTGYILKKQESDSLGLLVQYLHLD